MNSVRQTFARHGRWIGAAVLVTALVVIVTGWWLLAVYGAVNLAGTVIYLDGVNPNVRSGRLRHRWFPVLAIIGLPVGVYGALASQGSGPAERLAGDPGVRTEMSRATPSPSPGAGAAGGGGGAC